METAVALIWMGVASCFACTAGWRLQPARNEARHMKATRGAAPRAAAGPRPAFPPLTRRFGSIPEKPAGRRQRRLGPPHELTIDKFQSTAFETGSPIATVDPAPQAWVAP